MNPIAVPLAVAGLVFYFRKTGRRYRLLGWTFVFVYLMLTVLRRKPYFLGPAYPILFAAGAVAFERFRPRPMARLDPARLRRSSCARRSDCLRHLPCPSCRPPRFVRIYGSLGGAANAAIASGPGIMPQNLADRFGWDSLTQTVEKVYAALPPGSSARRPVC